MINSVYKYNACYIFFSGNIIFTFPCILNKGKPIEIHIIMHYSRIDFHTSKCFFLWKDVLNLLVNWLFLPSLSVISGYISLF